MFYTVTDYLDSKGQQIKAAKITHEILCYIFSDKYRKKLPFELPLFQKYFFPFSFPSFSSSFFFFLSPLYLNPMSKLGRHLYAGGGTQPGSGVRASAELIDWRGLQWSGGA